jgi:predicted ATPase
MALLSFSLQNFRSFVDRTTVELRPLTLLFGYNNAGKSALLRALPLLADSLKGTSEAPIALDSKAARGATFRDLLTNDSLSPSRKLTVEVLFRPDTRPNSGAKRISWTIRDLPDLRRQVIENFTVTDSSGKQLMAATWSAKESDKSTLNTEYDIQVDEFKHEGVRMGFHGLLPAWTLQMVSPTSNSSESYFQKELFQDFDELRKEIANVHWLTSVRKIPSRLYAYGGFSPAALGPDGTGAAEALAYDSIAGGNLLKNTSRWYEQHIHQQLSIVSVEDQFKLMIEPLANSPLQVNIADVGEGLVQVLPVLVASALLKRNGSKNPGILAIEEPESHLHPKLHSALAARFCELAMTKDAGKALIETHSVNFLLHIQVAIAQGLVNPENVMVYWVRQFEDGRARVEPVTFDTLGRPLGNWPPGVFTEDIEQARQLIKIQRASTAK